MGGAEEGYLYKASAHVPIVSLRGTLVNRLEMPKRFVICLKLTSPAYSPMHLSKKQSARVPKPFTNTLLSHLPSYLSGVYRTYEKCYAIHGVKF